MANMKESRLTMPDGNEEIVRHPEGWSENRVRVWATANYKPKARPTAAGNVAGKNKPDIGDLMAAGAMDLVMGVVPDYFVRPDNWEQLQADARAKFGDQLPVNSEEFEKLSIDDKIQVNARIMGKASAADREAFIRDVVGIDMNYEMDTWDKVQRGAGNPLTYIGVGRTGASTAVGKAIGTVGQFGEALASETVGTVAAENAPRTDNQLVNELYQGLFGTLGGSSTGMAYSLARAPVQSGVKAVEGGMNLAKEADYGEKANMVSEYVAQKQVEASLADIANSTSPAEITAAIARMDDVKEFLPEAKLEGLMGAMADNSAVMEYARKTAQHSNEFVENMKKNAMANLDTLTSRMEEISGVVGRVDQNELYSRVEDVYQRKVEAENMKYERLEERFEGKMADLTARMAGSDATTIGAMAKQAAALREGELRKQANGLYGAARMAGEGKILPLQLQRKVTELANSVRDNDVFGPDSQVQKSLREAWAPKEVEQEIDGVKFKVLEEREVSMTEVASLKRAVNTELGKQYQRRPDAPDRDQKIASLQQVRQAVDETIIDLSRNPETRQFANKLRDADKWYYKNLGLPLRAAGMAQINAAKFDKDVTAALMNDPQKVNDYLAFVGPTEGKQVLRHAMRLKAEKAVVDADGRVNTQRLANFLRDRTNQSIIEKADMVAEFSDLNKTARNLHNARRTHKQAYDDNMKDLGNGFFRTILNKNLGGAVREMTNNPQRRKQILAEVKKLPKQERDQIMAAVRSQFVVEGMMKETKSLADYMRDNKAAVEDIYGKEYLGDLNKFGKIFDTIKGIEKAIVHTLGADPVMDTLQQNTGLSLGEIVGTMRNQILSSQRKVINMGSKAYLEKGRQRYHKLSAEVLQDPEVLRKMANPPPEAMSNTLKALEMAKQGKKLTGQVLKDTVLPYYVNVLKEAGIMGAARGLVASQKEEGIQQLQGMSMQ